jgi:hypothetical protein
MSAILWIGVILRKPAAGASSSSPLEEAVAKEPLLRPAGGLALDLAIELGVDALRFWAYNAPWAGTYWTMIKPPCDASQR